MTGARYTVLATQGTSPGIVAELVYNILNGRVEELPSRGTVERVVLVATQHPLVADAARVALSLLKCCIGYEGGAELQMANVEDVVDRASFGVFVEKVESVLRGVEGSVVLDVTGGRVGMALAAYIAAESVVGRGRLFVTTTQVPSERYRELQNLFAGNREKLVETSERVLREGCESLSAEEKELLCRLVTREAVSSVLWP